MAKNKIAEVTLLESIVPHDRKESALRLFAENNYSINGMYRNAVSSFFSLRSNYDYFVYSIISLSQSFFPT